MKSSILVAVLLSATVSARAQTSSTTIAAPAAQSSTTIQAQQPAAAKKWSGFIVNETTASAKQMNELGSKAAVNNLITMGLNYKLDDTYTLGVMQIVGAVSHRENAEGAFAAIHKDAVEFWTTPITLGIKTNQTLLASDALKYTLRYDMPTGRYYREVKHSNGVLRMDVSPTWHASTKVDLALSLSPRLSLNSSQNSDAAVASDGIIRLVAAPSVSYNMSDKLSAYYAYTMDMQSLALNRSTANLDKANVGSHEVGMNIAAGPVSINPAITSDVNMADGSASLMTSDARAFSVNDNGYYLGLSAAF